MKKNINYFRSEHISNMFFLNWTFESFVYFLLCNKSQKINIWPFLSSSLLSRNFENCLESMSRDSPAAKEWISEMIDILPKNVFFNQLKQVWRYPIRAGAVHSVIEIQELLGVNVQRFCSGQRMDIRNDRHLI